MICLWLTRFEVVEVLKELGYFSECKCDSDDGRSVLLDCDFIFIYLKSIIIDNFYYQHSVSGRWRTKQHIKCIYVSSRKEQILGILTL